MAWRLYFRITIKTALGTVIIDIGYPTGATATVGALAQIATFTSESAAISKALSFNRRMQSAGIDCYAEVFGRPLDLNATPITNMHADTKVTPSPHLHDLSTDELAEQTYARVDTPDLQLKQAISLANTGPSSGGVTIFTDLPEDVGAKV